MLVFVPIGGVRTAAANPTSSSILGQWSGTVTAAQGSTPIALEFRSASAGRILLTLDMPVMHCYNSSIGVPVGSADGECRFDLLSMRWRLEGQMLRGTFGLGHLPMELSRGVVTIRRRLR